ncbi:hypothetical protein [Synechococcus phage S-B68]|jgi:hypothetical protein|nr:hypothetical protein [Synechococcus phage S-B68]
MIPEQEYHSLKETYKLLCDLIDPKKTPNIPKALRLAAKKCLKHYPAERTFDELIQGVEFFNPR